MRKIASTLLLFLFLFNIAGYQLLFSIYDESNRIEMDGKLNSGEGLITLRFNHSEAKALVFKDGGKEVLIGGEMYDVKSEASEGDYLVLLCLHDQTETQLLSGLQDAVENNLDGKLDPDKKQNNNSKNPVKDLFVTTTSSPFTASSPAVYTSYVLPLTSYLSSPLPLPPPENRVI